MSYSLRHRKNNTKDSAVSRGDRPTTDLECLGPWSGSNVALTLVSKGGTTAQQSCVSGPPREVETRPLSDRAKDQDHGPRVEYPDKEDYS